MLEADAVQATADRLDILIKEGSGSSRGKPASDLTKASDKPRSGTLSPPQADPVPPQATHLRDGGGEAGLEEAVIGRFLVQPPHGSQPLIDRGRGQFLFEEHRLVAMD